VSADEGRSEVALMPRKPKAEPSQHGGYRQGVPGGQGARLNLEITPTDLALVKEAAEAAGMKTSAWVRSVLIPEALRVLAKKAT
jgi:hypothetical protein